MLDLQCWSASSKTSSWATENCCKKCKMRENSRALLRYNNRYTVHFQQLQVLPGMKHRWSLPRPVSGFNRHRVVRCGHSSSNRTGSKMTSRGCSLVVDNDSEVAGLLYVTNYQDFRPEATSQGAKTSYGAPTPIRIVWRGRETSSVPLSRR